MKKLLIVCLAIIFFAGLNHVPAQASSSDGIESLIKALSSDDARTRGEAAGAIGEILGWNWHGEPQNYGLHVDAAVAGLIKA